MSDIGIVKSWKIGKGYRSKKECVLLNVQIDDPRDIQSIEYLFPTGQNSIPVEGDTVIIHEISPEYKVATASNTGVVMALDNSGENAIFAVENGQVGAVVSFLYGGEVVINRGTDFAVAYGKLENEFNELNEKFNKLVNTMLSWVPVAQDGGAALKTVLTGAAPLNSLANITTTKVEKVRL